MNRIEHLKNQEDFLTAHHNLVCEQCERLAGVAPEGRDFANFQLTTAMTVLQGEILMHRDAVRRLIAAYGRIEELERQLSAGEHGGV